MRKFRWCFLISMIIFQFNWMNSYAVNPKKILKKSFDRCQKIHNGYYEISKYMKYPLSSDTSINFMKGYFKKIYGDTLCSAAFHYSKYNNHDYLGEFIYNGNDYIMATKSDSSVKILNKSNSLGEITILLRQNGLLYYPFTNTKSYPFFSMSGKLDKNYSYDFCGSERINSIMSFHIKVSVKKDYIFSEGVDILNIEFNYWIDENSLLPVQFTSSTDAIINEEIVNQYEKFILWKYEVNTFSEDSMFTLKSFPGYYKR